MSIDENINRNKRLPVLDLAKSFPIIFMAFVHVLEVGQHGSLVIRGTAQLFLRDLIEFLGGISGVGIFILIMGFLVGWSASNTSRRVLKGIPELFALGMVVNIFEQWFPAVIGGDGIRSLIKVLPAVLATDIYFFDALIMFCLAMILLLKKEKRVIAAAIMILVSMILANGLNGVVQPTGNIWLDTVIGLFFRVNEYSYFPLFNWLPFPVLGYIAGSVFKDRRVSGRKFSGTARIISISIGVVLTFGAYFIMKYCGIKDSVSFGTLCSDNDYYNLSWLNCMEGIGLVVLIMNLYEGICCLTKGKIPAILSYLSENIMDIYIFHWLLIGLFAFALRKIENIYLNMLAAFAVLAVTVFLTAAKKRLQQKCLPQAK